VIVVPIVRFKNLVGARRSVFLLGLLLAASTLPKSAIAFAQDSIAAKVIEDNNALAASWKNERTDAEQAQARLQEQILDLKESQRTISALSTSSRVLDGVARNSDALISQSSERDASVMQLNARLAEVVRASALRDAAIENHMRAINGERYRWAAFYAARIARAQTECSLTGSSRAPKATTGKKK
jgi:hypothetical protein